MKILENGELAQSIFSICSGAGVRKCAVAFWGNDAPSMLFPDGTKDVEIILDIAMGCTSKAALHSLGVPHAENIRVLDGLHAKLYIGESGAIVTSANASMNALGKECEGGKLHELGVWIDAKDDPEAYDQAHRHFAALKSLSHVAGKNDIERAAQHPPTSMRWTGAASKPGSLLNLVKANPQDYASVLFVFGDEPVTTDEIDTANDAYTEYMGHEENTTKDAAISDTRRTLIAYCTEEESINFSKAAMVVMFWGRGEEFDIWAYWDIVSLSIKKGDKNYRAIFGRRDWRKFKNLLNINLSCTSKEVAKTDLSAARELAGENKLGNRWEEYGAFCLANKLSQF